MQSETVVLMEINQGSRLIQISHTGYVNFNQCLFCWLLLLAVWLLWQICGLLLGLWGGILHRVGPCL